MKSLFQTKLAVVAIALGSSFGVMAQKSTSSVSEVQPVKFTPEQEKAYAKHLELKSKVKVFVQLTENQAKMAKGGNPAAFKDAYGATSGTMQLLLTTPINEPLQPYYSITPCDPPTIHARVIVTETDPDGTTISYELTGFDDCPTIYNQIPNVDCMVVN